MSSRQGKKKTSGVGFAMGGGGGEGLVGAEGGGGVKGRGEEAEAVCRLRSLGACLIRVRMEAACRSATVYSSADRRESRLFNTSVKSFPPPFFFFFF